MLNHQPSLPDLQNQATVTQTEVQAIKSELAATTRKQALDHASLAEEKDGSTNEGWELSFLYYSLFRNIEILIPSFLHVSFNLQVFSSPLAS